MANALDVASLLTLPLSARADVMVNDVMGVALELNTGIAYLAWEIHAILVE
jgi:hypothetical protein